MWRGAQALPQKIPQRHRYDMHPRAFCQQLCCEVRRKRAEQFAIDARLFAEAIVIFTRGTKSECSFN